MELLALASQDLRLCLYVGTYLAGEEGLEPSHAGIKIQCLYQLGDSPTLVEGFSPFQDIGPPPKSSLTAQPERGWTAKLPHFLTCHPAGAGSRTLSCGICANTALPEPVIRACRPWSSSHRSACVTAGQSLC